MLGSSEVVAKRIAATPRNYRMLVASFVGLAITVCYMTQGCCALKLKMDRTLKRQRESESPTNLSDLTNFNLDHVAGRVHKVGRSSPALTVSTVGPDEKSPYSSDINSPVGSEKSKSPILESESELYPARSGDQVNHEKIDVSDLIDNLLGDKEDSTAASTDEFADGLFSDSDTDRLQKTITMEQVEQIAGVLNLSELHTLLILDQLESSLRMRFLVVSAGPSLLDQIKSMVPTSIKTGHDQLHDVLITGEVERPFSKWGPDYLRFFVRSLGLHVFEASAASYVYPSLTVAFAQGNEKLMMEALYGERAATE